MNKSMAIFIGVVLLIVLLVFSMTYTVNYNEVAIRTRFGRADSSSIEREPGLKFRLPLFADKITTVDTRLQLRESPLETILTTDGQQVMVRAFLLWQVNTKVDDGPFTFFTRYPGGIDEANQWLTDQLRTALITGLSRYKFDDLIGPNSRIDTAEQSIMSELSGLTATGIEPVSVGIEQLVLPGKTTTAVLQRMQATREYLSQAERYKGDAEASGIESRAKLQAEKIHAFANQHAEEIRAAGNKDAAKYLELMGQDQGLAIFLAWLDTLEASLSEQTTFVVPTAFAPFHLLRLDTSTDSRGIPQPVAEGGRISADQPVQATSSEQAPEKQDDAQSPSASRSNPSGGS